MAYDSTIPALGNLISNDIPAMQENFSLLESAQVVDEGSTADGDYIRYESGWQVCWGEALITYDNGNRLRSNVDFPVSFDLDRDLSFQYQLYGLPSTNADNEDVLMSYFGSISTNANRANNVAIVTKGDSFLEGDEADIVWIAVGRW